MFVRLHVCVSVCVSTVPQPVLKSVWDTIDHTNQLYIHAPQWWVVVVVATSSSSTHGFIQHVDLVVWGSGGFPDGRGCAAEKEASIGQVLWRSETGDCGVHEKKLDGASSCLQMIQSS